MPSGMQESGDRRVLDLRRSNGDRMRGAKKVALILETSEAFGRGLLLSISKYSHLHFRGLTVSALDARSFPGDGIILVDSHGHDVYAL